MVDERSSRREFLVTAGGIGAGLLLGGCGLSDDSGSSKPTGQAGVAARAAVPTPLESELVLYNYADYVNPKSYKAFRAQYPATKITRAYYASEEEVSAKLNAGGTSDYDVIVVAGSTAAQLQRAGLLGPIRKEWLPNLRNVDETLLNASYDPGARFSVPKNYGITGIAYETGAVKVPPRSWKAFFEQAPRYAPRTQLLEGPTSVLGAGLAAVGYRLGDEDPAHIKQALDFLKAHKRHIGQITTAKFFKNLGDKSVVLSQAWNGDVLRVRQTVPSWEYLVPEGSADRWAGVWAIPKGAKHAKAAHAWIDFLLDPRNAAREWEWSLYPVSVPSAVRYVPKAIADVPWMTVDDATLKRLSLDVLSPRGLREYNQAYTEFQAA
jgi:spermidine/putrescine transport system substrate-binding protein